MSAGRIVRNLIYRLRLAFPTLALSSGSGAASSGIAWADPNDVNQQYPIPFSYMSCFPRLPWTADTWSLTENSPPDTNPTGPRLSLVDAAGAAFARFNLQPPLPYCQIATPSLLGFYGFKWEAGFDARLNPFAIANGIEYILQGNADVQMTKTLAAAEEFVFAAVPGMHVVTEGPFDLSLAYGSGAPWNPIVFDHYDPTESVDLSLLFWDAAFPWPVNDFLGSLANNTPPFPKRTYTRWRLELKSPNPPAPYDIALSYATGPITSDLLQAADSYGANWNLATKHFYNPVKNGWTEALEFTITVW